MVLILMAPRRAIAAPPNALPEPAAAHALASGSTDKKAEAEAHLNKGNELFDRGDFGAALAEFLLARRLHPLWKATYNAGIGLEKLRRYDEALDMFEDVLRESGEAMPASNKETAQRKVTRLREFVGTIEVVGAEPGAAIVVDGRYHGSFPLPGPLRVGSSRHVVRAYKEGFDPLEATVEVQGKQNIVARLQSLSRMGRIRIAERRGRVLEVLVDGQGMGKTPWEGPLRIGEHTVELRGLVVELDVQQDCPPIEEAKPAGGQPSGEKRKRVHFGTMPVSVSIRPQRLETLTLLAQNLDATLRVTPMPVDASVAIDAVTVGRGGWEGPLRAGAHKIEVAALGFLPSVQQISIAPGEERSLAVSLERDPSSVFSLKPSRRPRFLAELSTAVALVPTFGGDIADRCTAGCISNVDAGAHGVLRGGYELGSGFGFGVAAGYLTVTQTMVGRFARLQPSGPLGQDSFVNDMLKLRGAIMGAWAGWSRFDPVPIHLRLTGGTLLGSLEDTRTGWLVPNADIRPTPDGRCVTQPSGSGIKEVPCSPMKPSVKAYSTGFFYVAPEIRVGLPLGRHVEVNLGLEVHILFSTFAPDALVGRAFLLVAPGVGARFDF